MLQFKTISFIGQLGINNSRNLETANKMTIKLLTMVQTR